MQLLKNSSSIYYMTVTPGGKYVYGNEHFLNRFNCHGLKDGSLKVEDTIVVEDLPTVQLSIKKAFENKGKHIPLIIRKPVNEDIVHTHWEFVCNESEPEIIHCIGYDISDIVIQKQKSNVITSRVEHIINSFSSGFYFLSPEWDFLMVNDAFLKTVDLKRKDVLGKNLWSLFPEDDDYNYPAVYREAMKSGKAQTFKDYRPDLKKWFGASVYPSDEGLAVFFKDITEQKESKDQLEDSRNKLLAVFESSGEGHILIDKDFKILWFNKAAAEGAKIFLKKDMKLGDSMLDFTLPSTFKLFLQNFKKALNNEKSDSEHLLEFEDGTKRWFKIRQSPAYDEENNLIGVVFNSQDIHDLKNYELQLEEQNQKLIQIAFKQSHEVRAPIARLLGLIELFKNEPNNSTTLEHLEVVSKELDILISDIIRSTE